MNQKINIKVKDGRLLVDEVECKTALHLLFTDKGIDVGITRPTSVGYAYGGPFEHDKRMEPESERLRMEHAASAVVYVVLESLAKRFERRIHSAVGHSLLAIVTDLRAEKENWK